MSFAKNVVMREAHEGIGRMVTEALGIGASGKRTGRANLRQDGHGGHGGGHGRPGGSHRRAGEVVMAVAITATMALGITGIRAVGIMAIMAG
jgi:hypothetical protein